ncbi:hypothetical protein C0V75_16760 [Tabrizicola sp. TH137]|uniref:hypothetical protein n=1 Tax=Tabrizicola sp. TH137 TaxID=2067452 RepID=UPI000C7A7237|nr:hypothetical protein [Tabrizicola sp. TH137]PLL11659.1 hypothetical protein C0V75_16760 [Tabrizicola sp. TH137]
MPEPASRHGPEKTLRHPSGRYALPGAALCAALLAAPAATASETHLLDVYLGSSRSDLVGSVRAGSYELADGEVIRFDEWYAPAIPDLTVLMLTELTDNLGLIWGASMGERGEKYRIEPAIHLGLTWQLRLSETAILSTSLHTLIGGDLRESSCSADYGTFGVSEVNCRLAASLLPPEETLDYMLDMPGWKETRLSVRFQLLF